MLSIESILAIFLLLALASGVYFLSKRLKVPYTVLLVLVGLLVVPLAQVPVIGELFAALSRVYLTPELLFFIFLPLLIFESAFNMNIRRMVDNIWSIGLLAIVGLLISTFLIGGLLFLLLPLVGIPIPFIIALLFGAIISSTDPVAVLSLFKEFGAPKRLTMIFEGESLFNDGTAVALFLIILAVAQQGFGGTETVLEGIAMFAGMVAIGIVIGLLMAAVFSRALRLTRSNGFVTATLLLISAHIVFIICELINEHGLFGLNIHVSSIIATTIAALFLGNYSRHILRPATEKYLGQVTEHLAFMANSLVFLLAGILFASSQIDFISLLAPLGLTILVVAVVRVLAVYAVTAPLTALQLEEKIPASWQLLLAWGSLRGALAIIIVLLIPDDLTVPGWTLEYSVKELMLALTTGCILATLFVKAPFIGPIMRKLGINKPEPLTEAHEADMGIYYLRTAEARLNVHKTKGFVREGEYEQLKERVTARITAALHEREQLRSVHGRKLFEQSLHLTAIDIEAFTLQQLYVNDEINETVYRKIKGKLNLQTEQIEYAQTENIDPSKYRDRKDVFDALVNMTQVVFDRRGKRLPNNEQRLQYYRGQMIIARKVTKILRDIQREFDQPVFQADVFDKVISLYDAYRVQCSDKMDALLRDHKDELAGYLSHLASRSVESSGHRALSTLHNLGMVSEHDEHDIERKYGLNIS